MYGTVMRDGSGRVTSAPTRPTFAAAFADAAASGPGVTATVWAFDPAAGAWERVATVHPAK